MGIYNNGEKSQTIQIILQWKTVRDDRNAYDGTEASHIHTLS